MKIKYLKISLHIFLYTLIIHNGNGGKFPFNFNSKGRIVGGVASTIEKSPFIVAIYAFRQFICGGSLIAKDMVITAAHCVKGMPIYVLMVKGGVTKLSEEGEKRSLQKIYLPKGYNGRTYHMDVAVLKLNKQMTGDKICTINLCTQTLQLGQSIQVYGWGQTHENSKGHVNTLRSVTLPLIARKKCKNLYKDGKAITNTMFCAGDLKTKDSCSGDSGGPAVYRGELCGIVSWGVGCARSNYPGVYTKISNVRSFLKKAMEMS